METVRLLYPDWLIVAVVAFIIILVFVGAIFFCVSTNHIRYIDALVKSSDTPNNIYFIKDIDGDNLINIEEIEQVTQRYNREDDQYEIIYYLKSLHTVKETFDERSQCIERFDYIENILNDFDC